MNPQRRLTAATAVGLSTAVVAAVAASGATAASRSQQKSNTTSVRCIHTASKTAAAAADPFAAQRALLREAVDAGWNLTPAGQQILGGASPKTVAPHTSVTPASGNVVTTTILATTNQLAPPLARPQAQRTVQSSQRSLPDTLVWMGCNYGQSGSVSYQVGYGWTWVVWKQQKWDGTTRDLDSDSEFCGFQQCIVGSQDNNADSEWQITFANEHGEYFAPTPQTESCFW